MSEPDLITGTLRCTQCQAEFEVAVTFDVMHPLVMPVWQCPWDMAWLDTAPVRLAWMTRVKALQTPEEHADA